MDRRRMTPSTLSVPRQAVRSIEIIPSYHPRRFHGTYSEREMNAVESCRLHTPQLDTEEVYRHGVLFTLGAHVALGIDPHYVVQYWRDFDRCRPPRSQRPH